MIGIHPVHRRLAELHIKADKLGGYRKLSIPEQVEFHHCIRVNSDIVRKLDELKQLAFVAHTAGDMEWEQEICRQIDEFEAKML